MKGITIWILGLFSFLAGSNVINAIIMWFDLGPESTFTPYLFGSLTGAVPVYVYLLISVVATLVFLGGTAHKLISDLSVKDQVDMINEKATMLQTGQEDHQKTLEVVHTKVVGVDDDLNNLQFKISQIDEGLARSQKEFSKKLVEQGDTIKQSLETGHETQQKVLDGMQGRVYLLDESLKGVKKGLSEQAEVIKGVNANLIDNISPELINVKEILAKCEQRDKKTAAAITKERNEIAEIKLKLEKLEAGLIMPKAMLESQSKVEDVKGIGPNKGAELKEIGILSASDLIMADPKVVAEKMGSSDKTVEKLQGRAQLSMIPGLKEKDLLLLEELDIIDRKSLAAQDLIELGKKINAIYKVNLMKGKVSETDKPTIEEIDSWIKFVRA